MSSNRIILCCVFFLCLSFDNTLFSQIHDSVRRPYRIEVFDRYTNQRLLEVQAEIKVFDGLDTNILLVNDSLGEGLLFNFSDSIVSLEVNIIIDGYEPQKITLNPFVSPKWQVYLEQSAQLLPEILIQQTQDSILITKDKLSFNADLFKSQTDIYLQDLLERLPGIELVAGKLTFEGKPIHLVQIDGELFSGNEPLKALSSVPISIIKRIEFIQSFPSVNASEVVNIVNIVTKTPRLTKFGEISGAFGTENRFQTKASGFLRNDKFKVTLLADANNLNREDVLAQPLPGLYEGINKIVGTGIYSSYFTKSGGELSLNFVSNQIEKLQENNWIQEDRFSEQINTSSQNFHQDLTYNNFDLRYQRKFNSSGYLNLELNYTSSFKNDTQNLIESRGENNEVFIDFSSSEHSQNKERLPSSKMSYSQSFGKKKYWRWSSELSLNALNSNENQNLFYQISTLSNKQIRFGNRQSRNMQTETSLFYTRDSITAFIVYRSNWSNKFEDVLAIAESDTHSYSSNELKLLGLRFQNEFFTNSITLGSKKQINRYWSLGLNATLFDYVLSNQDEHRNQDFDDHKQLFLPELNILRKVNPRKYFLINYRIKEDLPRMSQLTPFYQNSTITQSLIGNPKLKLGYNHQINFKWIGIGGTRLSTNIEYQFNQFVNAISRILYSNFPENEFMGIIVPNQAQVFSFENVGNKTSHRFRIKHSKNAPMHHFYIKYGINDDLIPGKINGEAINNHIQAAIFQITENYTPIKSLTLRSYADLSLIQITSQSTPNQLNQLYNWSINSSIRWRFFEKWQFEIESVNYQSVHISSRFKTRVINIINANLSMQWREKGTLKLELFDLLNQNADLTYTPMLNFIVYQNKLMLTRYAMVKIKWTLQ